MYYILIPFCIKGKSRILPVCGRSAGRRQRAAYPFYCAFSLTGSTM